MNKAKRILRDYYRSPIISIEPKNIDENEAKLILEAMKWPMGIITNASDVQPSFSLLKSPKRNRFIKFHLKSK